MERIMIIGSGGSGKTTLARQLGEKTGLPVVHLDNIWWSPGNWKHLEREEFDALLQKELEKTFAAACSTGRVSRTAVPAVITSSIISSLSPSLGL